MSGMIGMIMGTSVSRAVAAPNPTAGWFNSGIQSTAIQRITFANDTSTASVRGAYPTPTRYWNAGLSTLNDGWLVGGYGAPAPSTAKSSVMRIFYATDTNTASVRGNLALRIYQTAANGTSTYGWVVAGRNQNDGSTSKVSRIEYATDTNAAVERGGTNRQLSKHGGCGDGTTYGWFGGGYYPASQGYYWTGIQRLVYATDTDAYVNRGPLAANKYSVANTQNANYGWWYCGRAAAVGNTLVERIDYSNDTATASIRGPITRARSESAGVGSNDYGYVAGGNPSTNPAITSVDRITYANDTVTGALVGALSLRATAGAGVSGIQ